MVVIIKLLAIHLLERERSVKFKARQVEAGGAAVLRRERLRRGRLPRVLLRAEGVALDV